MSIVITNTTSTAAQPTAGNFREIDAPFQNGKRARFAPGAAAFRAEKARFELFDGWRVTTDRARKLMDSGRHAEAEKLLWEADSMDQGNVAFRNMLIKAIARQGRLEEAREVFDESVGGALLDNYTFNMMIREYVRVGRMGDAEIVLKLAEDWGMADEFSYQMFVTHHYKGKRYGKAEEVLRRAPENMRNSDLLVLDKIELLRKTKRYAEALEAIDEFLGQGQIVGKEKARVAKAYCLMELKRADEAEAEFRSLEKQLDETSLHYSRVLCGLVFCANVSREEAPVLKAKLEWLLPRNEHKKISAHIIKALAMLDMIPEMPELNYEAAIGA